MKQVLVKIIGFDITYYLYAGIICRDIQNVKPVVEGGYIGRRYPHHRN